jgi:segregation and condensation protein A
MTDAELHVGDEPTYRVALPVFEGPLDLLLHLIEREELDITAISLVQVTEQYLAYVQQLQAVRAETLADFLVIAARLLLMKSLALLPRPPAPPNAAQEEDPGEQLARQLREYKRFKAVAQGLGSLEGQRWRCFVRVAPTPRLQTKADLEGMTLEALWEAARRALVTEPTGPPVNGVVKPFTITIHQRAEVVLNRARAGECFTFRSLLEDAGSRIEIVVTLLAVLELLKRRRIAVRQDTLFGEIHIEAAPEPPNMPAAQGQPTPEEQEDIEDTDEIEG